MWSGNPMFNLKMSKKMKKFFSLMLVALVMLGVTACEQDVTIDTPKSEGLSFYAEIAMTRADLEQGDDGKWATVWEGNETLYVNEFAFTNTESEPSKFTCTTEGVANLVGEDVTIKMENNSVPESGKGIMIEQSITAFDPTSTITLTAKNAFFRFTYTGDVTFTLSQPLFVVDGEEVDTITVTADGDTWVSVLPGENVTLSYSVIDIKCKETTLNIVAGKIFNLKELAGPDPSTLTYKLVTNVNQLYDGAYVIVASGCDDSVAVMGATNTNGNNRPESIEPANVSDYVLYYTDAAILKLGVDGANYTLYDIKENGYLYAASSSSNYLKTKSTLDDNGKWSISIGGEPYAATVKSTGSYTRNWLRYNTSSKLFSCYSSGQADIYLYVGVDSSTVVKKTALDAPTVVAEANGKKITVTWNAVENADNYTVICDEQTETISSNDELKAEFTVSKYATDYTVSVVANPADDSELYYSSVAGTALVTTGADPRMALATPELEEGDVTDTSITVSWAAVENATNYDVYLDGMLKGNDITETTYTFNDLVSGNEYSISVVANGDAELYLPSEAGVITVSTTGQATSATLSFASKDQRTSFSTEQQIWEQNGITFTNNKASSNSNVADYANPVRLYANSEVIVEYGNMKKIEFTCGSNSYATVLKNSIGTVDGVTVTVSDSLVTVEFNENVDSFTIAKLTAQVRLKGLTVYTE